VEEFDLTRNLVERNYWLIRLRWIAVAGVNVTILFISQILQFSLPTFALYSIGAFLAIYNLTFLVLLSLIKGKESFSIINRIANAQISLDLLSLAGLIHFSGGVGNPFIFYFIFHMIIAGILLSRRASFIQATFAVLLFCAMAVSEYSGIATHYGLGNFFGFDRYNNFIYVSGVSFVFISTIYIAVYMATSISQRLRERDKILAETNVLLKKQDLLKSEYVLRVSHDIKEHLAAIQCCLEPVAGGITGELNPKQLDLVQRAVHRTAKLIFFVKALLEITRIRLTKEIKMDYFYFPDALAEAIAYISSKAKDKNISVDSIVEPSIDRIFGAQEYIQETLGNILANAVKYTPCNGKINIAVNDQGNRIFIQIKDTGIGIPADELPKIFEEFFRASNAKEAERDGTGLGLSLAKQVIERHNGKIWVESEEGKGSTFSIELPK
jgi:signal transduction histidine kinase